MDLQSLISMNRLSLVYQWFLNPLMMIPFIFVPVINSIIAYGLMAFHIVGKGIIETPWTTPAPLGAALGCMDFKAAIMVIGLIILDMVFILSIL